MRLIEAIKESGNPFFIPDCTRAELPELFLHLGFKRGVEVGVSWGENIVSYCKAGLEIYGVDPWENTEDFIYKKIISIDGKYGKTIEGVHRLAQERTAEYPNCHLIKKTSMEAIRDFPDKSLDFVYIDGDHTFGYVAMDLMKWTRKVRKGGVVAGHDYMYVPNPRAYRDVGYVVDAFARTYDFKNWYVIGKPGEGRHDDGLSYVFFKHW